MRRSGMAIDVLGPHGHRWPVSKENNMSETTDTPDHSAPILTIDGARATIRLNRPTKLNRLSQADLDTLMGHFDRVEAKPAIRVLVLTGTGRAFSAGFDL